MSVDVEDISLKHFTGIQDVLQVSHCIKNFLFPCHWVCEWCDVCNNHFLTFAHEVCNIRIKLDLCHSVRHFINNSFLKWSFSHKGVTVRLDKNSLHLWRSTTFLLPFLTLHKNWSNLVWLFPASVVFEPSPFNYLPVHFWFPRAVTSPKFSVSRFSMAGSGKAEAYFGPINKCLYQKFSWCIQEDCTAILLHTNVLHQSVPVCYDPSKKGTQTL